uniref:Uncharacterized protein n=1 Tax=Grus japonensis Chaphamaparvovirus TaxID=2794490 RepID=A0A8A4XD20_9VIRU|nr:MAG: hypothetical protein [Grus japonensis Chaphamaparvovirus]
MSDGRVHYDLNKRQWYAVRDKLQKRGLWRYAEKGATKRLKTGQAEKRSADDDPDEGTSAATGAKRQSSKIMELNSASFVLVGHSTNTQEENTQFCNHASILIKGRWGAITHLETVNEVPYLIVKFERFNIGIQRLQQGLGDLACLLKIQRIPQGMEIPEVIQLVQLQETYNIPTILESELEEETTGPGIKRKRYQK